MSERKYKGAFVVDFEITIPDEAILRVLNNEDGWQEQFYKLDEGGVVEMIARCCGIWGLKLRELDGFADMTADVSGVKTKYDMVEWEMVP